MRQTLARLKTFFFAVVLISAEKVVASTWETSAGNEHSQRHFNGSQINPENIDDLELLWRFDSGFSKKFDTVQSTPIFTGENIITVNLRGQVIALNPTSGSIRWQQNLSMPVGRRGLLFFKKKNEPGSLYVPTKNGIAVLNPENGHVRGTIDSGMSLLQPIIFNEKIYVATLHDGVKAFDLDTHRQIWHKPLNTEGVNVRIWSGFSGDPKNNLVFVVTSNPGGLVGEARTKDDNSVSVVAIDANNGKMQWRYQHIASDIWDFDLVSNPIILNDFFDKSENNFVDIVIALSKTGDVLVLRADNGQPLRKGSVKLQEIETVPGSASEFTVSRQKKILWPEPVSSTKIDFDSDFSHLDQENQKYVMAKLRSANSGWYMPTSINYDIATYGLHGGPGWPGGAVAKSNKTYNLFVTTNKNPWILRIRYNDKHFEDWVGKFKPVDKFFRNINKNFDWLSRCWNSLLSCPSNPAQEQMRPQLTRWNTVNWSNANVNFPVLKNAYKYLPGAYKNKIYEKNCLSCHGFARQGAYQSEFYGDGYIPSLVGLHMTQKWQVSKSFDLSKNLHQEFDIEIGVNESEYDELIQSFLRYDLNATKSKRLHKTGFWQLLLDKNGLPATRPPWGNITSLSLNTGKINWSKPFGVRKQKGSGKSIAGDINFGGIMTSQSGLVFATGTPDEMLRVYAQRNGDLLWKTSLPYAGSTPPMGVSYRGCDIIIVAATGGRFLGFGKNGDSTLAFKLKSCSFDGN